MNADRLRAQQEQIAKQAAQRVSPTEAQFMRMEWKPMFDTVRFTANTGVIPSGTDLAWFLTPKGTVGAGFTTSKTMADTNNTIAGKMPAEKGYLITEMGIQTRPVIINPTTPTADALTIEQALQDIGRQTVFSLDKGDGYVRQYGRVEFWPAGYGTNQYGSLAIPAVAAGMMISAGNGQATRTARVRLEEPITLEPNCSYNFPVNLVSPVDLHLAAPGAQQIDLTLLLFGYELVAAQA